MTKQDLIAKVAEKSGLNKKAAGAAVDALFETIAEALAAGDKVNITGFGSFEVRERAARMARNLQTGEMIQVPASKAPAFRAGKGLKEACKSA